MKKLLFAICAVATLASCSKDEVVSYDKGEVIGFSNPFVNKATRADYSQGNTLKAFKVYGTVTPTGGAVEQIYNGADVTHDEGTLNAAWNCTVTNYWLPKANYAFAAIADGKAEDTEGLPETIKFTVADGNANKDLLYATASVTTNENSVPTQGVNNNKYVAFNFTHLLSKMQFTVKNATNQTYKVTDISVTGFTDKGIYTVDGGTWAKDAGAANDVTLTFGTTDNVTTNTPQIATATRQFLPLNQELDVAITYDVYQNGTVIGELTKEGTIPATTYAKNTLYNVVATLTGNAITFTVSSVNDWDADVNGDDAVDTNDDIKVQ